MKISKYISSALMVAALGTTFTACDDWTEPEHVDLNYGTIVDADSEAYVKYLADLREYRSRNHKKVYTWFGNLESAFGSQGHRISAIPDSVDIIVLENPQSVTNQMIQEMYEARTDKGQQFSYCIDLDQIIADYTSVCEEMAAKRIAYTEANGEDAEIPAELQDPNRHSFIAEETGNMLQHFDNVGFDCLMAGFKGQANNYMSDDEITAYKEEMNLFLGIIYDWHQRHTDVAVDILGRPQYIDHALLGEARMVFLSESLDATNTSMFSIALTAAGNAVPESKIGVVASIPFEKLGVFSTGEYAVIGMGRWAAGQKIGAVGTTHTAEDYFLTNGGYTTVRDLIQLVNPSAK
ncbi:MAG: glycoside hydrolase family 18 [Firmicutes bacterium]|nr:glycoside hydrolase family 18 [Bacillota bacterium]MCM1400744.1 glycoside hydrolase family 18 [Bacteroides sp.]MCM1476837.1 glycoside hydrolase family 18 [Bacteroides sp.]